MGNVVADGVDYPYVQWRPMETGGVQHTDQEFTDSSGNSYLFRMYNAYYDSSGPYWTIITSTISEAYATVQNPDGSIHYYSNYNPSTNTFEPTWQTWFGSGNNTAYNAVDYGLTANGSASGNNTALGTLFTALGNAAGLTGGFVRIPQNHYPIVGSSSGIVVPTNTIIQALGTGGFGSGSAPDAFHFTISDSGGAATTFLSLSGDHTDGGTYLRNLAFSWNNPAYAGGSGSGGDTALSFATWNGKVQGCTFRNCPTVANFAVGTKNSLDCTLDQCTINYDAGPINATAILLTGQQTALYGPSEFFQKAQGSHGPSGCICVSIGGGASFGTAQNDHNIIRDIHMYDWTICIDYADTNDMGIGSGCINTTVASCELEAWTTAVNMTTYSSSGNIYGQYYANNTINKSHDSTNPGAIVYIDTNGGANSNVSGIYFTNCLIFSAVDSNKNGMAQQNQYGVEICSGDGIIFTGCKISNVGTKSGSDGTANVAFTTSSASSPAPGSVIFQGCDLRPTYAFVTGNGASGAGATCNGVLVDTTFASGTRVEFNGCDLTGFTGPGQKAVNTTSATIPSGTFFVNNCPGYNDQNTVINT